MSRHVARKQRWTQVDTKTYSSALGRVAYQQDAWYALLEYRTLVGPERPGGMPSWRPHAQRLGPFKRPRNAMVALEREATLLRNRHCKEILFAGRNQPRP
jgi:hypothetical protein